MAEIQDIFKEYGAGFLKTHSISSVQYKAFRAIRDCRTAALGAHLDICDTCGFKKISYNSCRNRHCPKCQTFAKEKWIDKQNQSLLNTNYFHIVFTIPEELNPLLLKQQESTYSLFFKAVSQTLLELCSDSKYLGATPGITAVLHTWGQNLSFHPHIHCIVTGGGLTRDQKWRSSRQKFFLPVKVLSRKFRGKFLAFLRQAGLAYPDTVSQKDWVVYCKPPFQNASKVLDYLGRYTHRVAISNDRILRLRDGQITFSWRDYKDHHRMKVMTLSASEFIRRFLLHILPSGFRKIRHFGILASRNKSQRLTLCRKLTHTRPQIPSVVSVMDRLHKMLGPDFDRCPCCHIGRLSRASPALKNA